MDMSGCLHPHGCKVNGRVCRVLLLYSDLKMENVSIPR